MEDINNERMKGNKDRNLEKQQRKERKSDEDGSEIKEREVS
jgi:hypothetical protein